MKTTLKKWITPLSLALLVTAGTADAAGLMNPVSGGSALNIQSQHVNVIVQDGFAITEVEQVFSNPNTTDLEAIYSFPVPDKGAVSEFTVWIDGQPVIGEVIEAKKARKLYEEEKAAGRETGITEKKKHHRFEVRVAPVRAGQDAKIRLVYLQPTTVDTGIGRYVYPLEEGGTDQEALNFWTTDIKVQQDFSFNMDIRSSYPIAKLRLPQHPGAQITQHSSEQWEIHYGNTTATAGSEAEASVKNTTATAFRLDQDIVAYWKLQPNLPGSVDLVTYREPGKKRGTFMMTLTPGDDLAQITQGRDWVFVLDMSGSMTGKYQTLLDGVQRALEKLNAEDRFQLVLFDNHVEELTSTWINATPENVNQWSQKLAQTSPRGGTNLYAGLKSALRKLDADRTSALVLVTDGEANVGITEKKQFLTLLEKRDVRLFTAVMGNGANRPLLDAMAKTSNGFATSVSNSDDITGKLLEFTSKVSHQALHDLDLKISGIKVKDLSPARIGSLYRGEQLTVFGHYWGEGEARVTLQGKVSSEKKTYSTRFDFPANNTLHPELERLWAYASIRDLQDTIDYLGDDADYKNAVIDLGVENSLVTDYTSMVVMRDEQFTTHGIERRNKARRAREVSAQQQRLAAPVQSYRVDTATPAFHQPRASFNGGGGSFWELLMMLPLLIGRMHGRR
ncbi:MAG TPA: VWA domain-containing protein [Gammaproteobacteria bacterium]|nr:VWA domain-containing protein [Gammaproteobacteria bacterium]